MPSGHLYFIRLLVINALSYQLLFVGNREDGMFLLDKVFRQQNDTLFLNILNDLRQGLVTPQAQRILGGKVQQSYLRDREIAAATTSTASSKQDGSTDATDAKVKTVAVRPTKLFSTNRDVDSFNASEMTKLAQADQEGEVFRYEAIDEGTEPFLNQLRQGTKAPALLELRVGAQVRVWLFSSFNLYSFISLLCGGLSGSTASKYIQLFYLQKGCHFYLG